MRICRTCSFLLAFVLCTAAFAAPREDETHRRIEMTAVAADGALAENLAKYGMKAYRTTNGGPKFSCLTFTLKDATLSQIDCARDGILKWLANGINGGSSLCEMNQSGPHTVSA